MVSDGIPWAVQERGAHQANVLPLPALASRSRPVDRILWNAGRHTIDEIVVHDCIVHLEQMSDTSYWMGISKGGADFTVNLSHRGRLPMECTGYDNGGIDGPEWDWDRDDEHVGGAA